MHNAWIEKKQNNDFVGFGGSPTVSSKSHSELIKHVNPSLRESYIHRFQYNDAPTPGLSPVINKKCDV